jgi:hypothetical protein
VTVAVPPALSALSYPQKTRNHYLTLILQPHLREREREREPSLWCPDLEHTKTHDTPWLRHQRTPPFWSASRTGCNGTRDSTMGQFFMEQTKLAKEHELFHSMKSCLIVLSLQRYVPRQDNRRRLLWSFSNKYSSKQEIVSFLLKAS